MQELEGVEFLRAAGSSTEEVKDGVTLFALTNEVFEAITDMVQRLSPEQLKAVRPQTFLCPQPTFVPSAQVCTRTSLGGSCAVAAATVTRWAAAVPRCVLAARRLCGR